MRDKISEKIRGVCIKLPISQQLCVRVYQNGAKSMLRHNTFTLSSALKNS